MKAQKLQWGAVTIFLFSFVSAIQAIRIAPRSKEMEQPDLVKEGETPLVQLEESIENMQDTEYEMSFDEDKFILQRLKELEVPADVFNRSLYAAGWYPFTPRQKGLWVLAYIEEKRRRQEHLDLTKLEIESPRDVSFFGKSIPKVPRSWVEAIFNISDERKHRYMFSGSLYGTQITNRAWLIPFVKEHFDNSDYFRCTVCAKIKDYEPIGKFDQTLTDTGASRPKSCGKSCWPFDGGYWELMRRSKFILCPGGDAPFSYRFYESFLAGALPVINDPATDWLEELNGKPYRFTLKVNKIGYDYLMAADYPHVYDHEKAKLNLKKFMRYQTFMEGDNDPEKDRDNGVYPS